MSRYFSWLPLAFLTACAVQQPAVPPASQTQAVATPSEPVAPDTAPAAPPVAENIRPATPAASAEQIATLRKWVAQQNRLYAISAPLLINNTPLCKRNARYLLGLTAKTKYSYSNDYVAAAQAAFGLDDRLQVTNVMSGSGAEKSGVQPGDILLAVENKSLPKGPNAERDAGPIVAAAMQGRTSLRMTVQRNGERLALNIPLTAACAFGVELGNADSVNSYADGHRVLITRGMLDFTRSDEEVAYALAKEIAHNALTPVARPRMGIIIDSLRGFRTDAKSRTVSAAELKPYSPVLDATADKLSLYMLSRAGYDIDNALPFWKRLASQYPETVSNSHTALHPFTAYRFSVMTEIAQVIKAKKKYNRPMLP